MGTDSERADVQDRPQRTVELPAFRIDKYPVTNAQYARFVAATGNRPPIHWENGKIPEGMELNPVTMVSWFDAKRYAEWAGKRLPTEAEWERAARGTDGRRWPWGDDMDSSRLNTYYLLGSTTEVEKYPSGASPDGVMDMAGNVSEWVADDFQPYPGGNAPSELFQAKVPVLPKTSAERSLKVVDFMSTKEKYKVLRGGSWKSDPFSTSAYHRNFSWPNFASNFFGFRCAQDVKN
jgi:iron(II)-dependent oxidoreductase